MRPPPPLLAGFDCGRLGWSGHDLLASTRHVPGDRMEMHYSIVQQHGFQRARDGLPWRHDPAARIAAARRAGIGVIWDLNHFDPPEDPVSHVRRVVQAADLTAPLWICPVNEPSLYPRLCGMPQDEAVRLAIGMARMAKDHHPDLHVLTADPITGIGDRQFAATDAMVQAGIVDVVGVNYYPHTARTSLVKVLTKTARRYGLPVMLAETSWHDGHPQHHRRFPGWHKGDWLRHTLSEIAIAIKKGADVVGACWYPVVDCPPWNHPRSRRRWSHGLIRQDLSVDAHLAEALASARRDQQLEFELRRAS